MCGIVGFTGKTNSEVLEKMTNCIHHRGPDDSGYIVSKDFSVGFRRLAIIDLTQDIYPIQNEDATMEIILNGEIYNYQVLRQELEDLGHKFKTGSDSETVLHGYEEWGADVLERLRGMFVFVLNDKRKDELFIARDRLGIKPMYYARCGGQLLFSSEIKAIIAASETGYFGEAISREPNDNVVMKFLHSRIHDDSDETFFKNIKRLMPGHFMIIDSKGSHSIRQYWFPKFNPEFKSKKSDFEYAEEFKHIFTEAVDLHLIADVPVGVTLSGGLDSSGITTLAKKLYEERYPNAETPITAFSAVHPGETVDESKYIDNIVKHTGIKSVKIQPKVDTFWDEVDRWTYFQEEPVISGAPYAYFTVMREARKYVTVLLSGQGGDELLAGYLPYFFTYLQTAYDQKQFFAMARETWMGKDLYFKYFIEALTRKFKKEDVINPYDSLKINNDLDSGHKFIPSRNLNERLFTDVTSTTTPCLLRYEDKNSMANSLESRVPFFDHKVVEYIFNLPVDQKLKFGWTRFIYRNAMKGVIPDENRLRRSKVGFTNPEWEWIERKADNFREIFNSESFKSRKYWDAEKVSTDFELTLKGLKTGDVLYFWRLFSVEYWLRTYVDNFEVIKK